MIIPNRTVEKLIDNSKLLENAQRLQMAWEDTATQLKEIRTALNTNFEVVVKELEEQRVMIESIQGIVTKNEDGK